jgi:hypothetical protein
MLVKMLATQVLRPNLTLESLLNNDLCVQYPFVKKVAFAAFFISFFANFLYGDFSLTRCLSCQLKLNAFILFINTIFKKIIKQACGIFYKY